MSDESSKPIDKLIKSTKSLVIKNKGEISIDKNNFKHHLKQSFGSVLVNKNGAEYPDDCKYLCFWCRKNIQGNPMGVPISVFILPDGTKQYICDGWLCGFECTLAFIRKYKDPLYINSEVLLTNLFYKLYPGKELKEAVDWRLLKRNGGDLDDSEASKCTQYHRTTNIRLTPVSVYYQI